MHAATLLPGYGAKGLVQSEIHFREYVFKRPPHVTWHPQNLEQISGVWIVSINSLSIA